MLTQERLKEYLSYNPKTGIFIWIKQPANHVKIGQEAGRLVKGYVRIGLKGNVYQAHRLAWFYMTGKWPENEIDHFDTIKHHNWWSNLREANDSQNNQNLRKPKSHNTSGYLGVVSRSNGRFQALIGINGKSINLGMFKDPKLAHEAYLTAKRKLHEFNTI